jgi:hypothetical protein
MSNAGGSMARIALAQQVGRQRAQQYKQQMALEQAYLEIARQKAQQEGGEIGVRTNVLQQGLEDTQKNNDLARAVAGNMFQKQVPGGMNAVMTGRLGPNMNQSPMQMPTVGDVTSGQSAMPSSFVTPEMMGSSPTNVGPTQQNAEQLNQGDLVRNAVELMARSNPALLERMMEGVNVGPNQVNRNLLTGDVTRGMPAIETPYQQAMVNLGQSRLQEQENLGNRRMDSYDQRNIQQMHDMIIKVHQGLAKLYENEGDLDKAKEETDSAEKEASTIGQDETTSDGSQQGGGKPLDQQTAMGFLKQAGGDKDRARQLAKQAGFTF